MYLLLKFILFWNKTLHVSDGLSVHHQEFKTVLTASSVCQTDSDTWLLAGTRRNSRSISCPLASRYLVPASKQVAVSIWRIPVAVCTVLNSWWWTERPSETCRVLSQNKINLKKLVHLVGFSIEIYYDARPYEHPMCVHYITTHVLHAITLRSPVSIVTVQFTSLVRNEENI